MTTYAFVVIHLLAIIWFGVIRHLSGRKLKWERINKVSSYYILMHSLVLSMLSVSDLCSGNHLSWASTLVVFQYSTILCSIFYPSSYPFDSIFSILFLSFSASFKHIYIVGTGRATLDINCNSLMLFFHFMLLSELSQRLPTFPIDVKQLLLAFVAVLMFHAQKWS